MGTITAERSLASGPVSVHLPLVCRVWGGNEMVLARRPARRPRLTVP